MTEGRLDFETYSEAGHVWNEETGKWSAPQGARKKGLSAVGSAVYAEHPTTEVLTASYKLPGDAAPSRWKPGDPPPQRLFDFLARGGVIRAHNAMFERAIWAHVCVRLYGWPELPFYALRCSMATAHVNAYPGALGDLSNVLQLPTPKDARGKALLDKLSVPRNRTKTDPRTRVRPEDAPADFAALQDYCDTDVEAEGGATDRMEPMTPDEEFFWHIDQEINWRGLGIDRRGVRDCLAVLNQALEQYGREYRKITGLDATQLEASRGWLSARGVHLDNMQDETIGEALKRLAPHPPGGVYEARRVLEIRQLVGSASVKKLFAMENMASRDDRLRNLIVHHGARTGRPTGEGAQPLNMPRGGPDLKWCITGCARPFRPSLDACPWCGVTAAAAKKAKWGNVPKECPPGTPMPIEHVLEVMRERSLELVEWYFGDAVKCISGCLRGLFVAEPGHELIASDYSAIEAVVTAMLAGEEWRIETFRKGIDIYLAGASKITGRTLEFYEAHKLEHGENHPDRQDIGKISELACGFGGWVNSFRAFGYEGSDEEAKRIILPWRAASPKIPEMWGGQWRGLPWDPNRRRELYGFEGAAIQAVQNPGQIFSSNGIDFQVRPTPAGGTALKVRLLSGRELTYHNPRCTPSSRDPSTLVIVYWTHNSNPKYGPLGWVPMITYGGRLTENIVQAIAHDILRFAIINLRAAGYPTVLHVYDEIIGEIPIGRGSLEEFERIMATLPAWAAGWPIRAAGGWRGRRYRKS